jgi:hypothetical protein
MVQLESPNKCWIENWIFELRRHGAKKSENKPKFWAHEKEDFSGCVAA